MPKVQNVVGLLFCLAVVGWGDALVAAPRIDSVSLRGLQIGATTTVVVAGAELMPAPRVWLGRDLVQAVAKEGSTAERAELMIQLPTATDPLAEGAAESPSRGAAPGIRQLRIANEFGISNPVAVVVDDLPESEWVNEISAWPIALSGTCDGATRMVTSLTGKRDQLLAVEVEARRLGSMLNPTIRVLDEQGAQIAWAQADPRLDGDARLVTTLPRDGKYQIELQDALFQGQPPAFFRLKITNEATAMIPFWRAMNFAEVESRGLGALLGGGGYDEGWSPILLPRPSAAPTGLLRMYVSPWREVVEDEDALVLGPLPAPVGINGRIGSAGEADQYVVVAPPGKTLRVQCIAERANSPLDGVLAVHASDGNQLAAADDQPGTVDPGLEFTMPGEPVTLSLRDLRHRGGEEFRYRLSVIPADEPTLRLTTDADRYLIPSNGVALVRVHADRPAADAAVSLSVGPLPEEIVVENGELPAGTNDALVTLRGTGSAASVAWLHGTGASDNSHVVGLAPAGAAARFSPWLANEIAISTAPAAPLALTWSESAGDVLTLASNTMLGVQLDRSASASGPVRLSLVTTQVPPMRQENNQNVPDLPKTLRLAQEVVVPADQSTVPIPIAVPADLPPIPYDIALQAELLSADGSQVLATVFSPSRRMSVVRPSFMIELADAASVTPGAENQLAVELHGKVVRPEGFQHPVAVKITGLPESVPAPQVIVPEGQSDFTLTATLPGTLTLAELGAARVAAASELAPGVVVAAANEVSLELRLGVRE